MSGIGSFVNVGVSDARQNTNALTLTDIAVPGVVSLGFVDDGILVRSILIIVEDTFSQEMILMQAAIKNGAGRLPYVPLSFQIKINGVVARNCDNIVLDEEGDTDYSINQVCKSFGEITLEAIGIDQPHSYNPVITGKAYIIPYLERIY
jgi:hypothetical protein